MTASIQQLDDTEIREAIEDFDSSGGCIQFELFRIEGTTDEYDCHHKTALHTLKTMNKGSGLFKITIDEAKLRDSGHRIEIGQFFGPLFDIDKRRVIVKGRTTNHLNNYFFHDGKEQPSEIVDVKTRPYYQDYTGEFVTLGFAGAFLDPPYSLRIGQTIFHQGDYFLKFCDTVFGNMDNLVVYRWSTDSSNIFDAGKEWWGSFFWTVFNKTRDYYIGIVASTTD